MTGEDFFVDNPYAFRLIVQMVEKTQKEEGLNFSDQEEKIEGTGTQTQVAGQQLNKRKQAHLNAKEIRHKKRAEKAANEGREREKRLLIKIDQRQQKIDKPGALEQPGADPKKSMMDKSMMNQTEVDKTISQGIDDDEEEEVNQNADDSVEVKMKKVKLNNMFNMVCEQIAQRYELIQKMGRGSYGTVWRAIDKSNRNRVGIKKINHAFANKVDAQRSLREIAVLQELNVGTPHPNIMQLHNVRMGKNNKDLYLIFEFLEADLHTVIRANICTDEQRCCLMWQIARAIYYMHGAKPPVLHRDIKPSNICVNQDCTAKLVDFGSARTLADQHTKEGQKIPMSDYIATRWYRPPEVLLGSPHYDTKIDIWAFGCTIAELTMGQPLFPGTSTLNQLSKIISVIGLPSMDELEQIGAPMTYEMFKNLFVEQHRTTIAKVIAKSKPTDNINLLDLLTKMLRFDPEKRPDIEEVINHRYFMNFHDQKYQTKCTRNITADKRGTNLKDLKDRIKKIANQMQAEVKKKGKAQYYEKLSNYN